MSEFLGRTLLGKYRIERSLGRGGMGSVWKGVHLVTGRNVAIKILDERLSSNLDIVRRFGREARAASAIEHEGIVEVLDLDQTEEGQPFLVMEFLEGQTLAARIQHRLRLVEDETIRLGVLLLDALDAAHEHGVVHRDLKPENIFLVPGDEGEGAARETIKVIDFGISHKEDEMHTHLTMTGSILGTPHYMSPEQARGDIDLDRRVDIYAAGVVLYECLVGDVPFDAANYNKLIRLILDAPITPPSERGVDVSAPLEQLIMRALAKDRAHRPSSAREFARRLRELEEQRHAVRPRTASASFSRSSLAARSPSPSYRPPAPPPVDAVTTPFSKTDRQSSPPSAPPLSIEPIPPSFRPPRIRYDAPIGDLDIVPPTPPSASWPGAPLAAGEASLDPFDEGDVLGTRVVLELDESARVRPQLERRQSRPEDAAELPRRGPIAPPPRTWLANPLLRRAALTVLAATAIVVAIRLLVNVRPPDRTVSEARDAIRMFVDVEGLPMRARLTLDGVPGASIPLHVAPGPHVLEIEAPGYEPLTLRFDSRDTQRVRAQMPLSARGVDLDEL